MRQALLESAMRQCIVLAREAARKGNYPVGAVVISSDGSVIGSAGSELTEGVDPSAHPEVCAMRQAAQNSLSRYLPGSWLVSTMEPCPMCAAMAVWARLDGIAYGTAQDVAAQFGDRLRSTKFTFRQITIRCEEVLAHGTPTLQLEKGLLGPECDELLRMVVEEN